MIVCILVTLAVVRYCWGIILNSVSKKDFNEHLVKIETTINNGMTELRDEISSMENRFEKRFISIQEELLRVAMKNSN